MTAAVLAGVGVGAALWLLASGLVPAREPLDRALARLGSPDAVPAPGAESQSLDARMGVWLRRIPAVERLGEMLAGDLRVLRRDPDEQIAEIAAYGAVGLLWAPVVTAGARYLGFAVPWMVPVWLSALGAVGTVVLAVRHVRQRAAQARVEFGYALSAYCDVVAMTLTSGRGLHAALFDAAAQGDGWAWRELREALHRDFYLGRMPAESLTRLGRELQVDDLIELGSTLTLADEEGASVAGTVASKAASLRERLVADAETKAASATERMGIPGAMILIGFLWFIAYPAIHLILHEAG